MTQSLVFVWIHLVGVAVCFAVGPHRRPWLCCALGFPVGLAVVVVATLGMLVARMPYNGWSFMALTASIALGCAAMARRRGIDRRAVIAAATWTVGFALVCVPLTYANFVIMTHDSHIYVMFAQAIAEDGKLTSDMIGSFDDWGVFQVIAQSMATFTREDFLYSLPIVLGSSFAPVFGITLWAGLGTYGVTGRRRAVLAGLVTVALFSINMVIFHLFYLHTNMASGIYLFCFAVLFWLGEVERDPSFVPIALICAVALAFQRTETPVVALLFLILTVPRSELPRRAITPWLAGFVLAVGIWYEVLAHHVASGGNFLTPTRCRLIWLALVACFGWWLATPRSVWIRRINTAFPVIIAAFFALALVAAFAARTDHMVSSAENWYQNHIQPPFWSQSWYAIALLAALAALTPAPRFRHVFVVGIPAYFAFVMLIALSHPGYRLGVDGSAIRMTMHIVSLVVFYVGLKLTAALGAPSPRPAQSGAP